MSFGAVLMAADGGLLAIMLAALAWHEPFTLQYAREQVAPKFWTAPAFRRANNITAGVWMLAFAIMTVSDGAAVLMHKVSLTSAAAMGLVALAGALTFTVRYPIAALLREPPQ